MGKLLDVAKAALAETVAPAAGGGESEPITPIVTPAPKGARSEFPRPNVERELVQRLRAAGEPVSDLLPGIKLPSRRCRACNSWLYWVSVHGAVVCVTCHPPANRDLVKTWHWLPEGEGRKVQ